MVRSKPPPDLERILNNREELISLRMLKLIPFQDMLMDYNYISIKTKEPDRYYLIPMEQYVPRWYND